MAASIAGELFGDEALLAEGIQLDKKRKPLDIFEYNTIDQFTYVSGQIPG